MNATQANAIALSEILNKLGYPAHTDRGHDCLYLSPFRDEKAPSFHVNNEDNIWYDFGAGRGGDVVDFACAWLESRNKPHSVHDALCFLSDMLGRSVSQQAFPPKDAGSAPTLEIVNVQSLHNPVLLHYLENDRKIPRELAQKYLVHVEVHNRKTGKTFHAVGMKNVEGGFELRNAFFKGCVGRKDITFIRGDVYPAPGVHVFEGIMDLLSALADQEVEAFAGDMIVLHSLACLSKALPYIENYESYRRLFAWLDNDRAGEKASRFLQSIVRQQPHLDFCAMNPTYEPFKDVNECRVRRLGLSPSQR